MEEESDRVGQRIDDARRDWESKEQDSAVPGAQAEPDEETNKEESDQLPEEGPGEQVPDDQPGEARGGARQTPGVPGEDEKATGNPDAAGSEDPDEE
jgi:hypothetical protein